MTPTAPSAPAVARRWRDRTSEPVRRDIPAEIAVALVHDAVTTAVMMATPADLEDLAVGFTLTEGVAALADIAACEIAPGAEGVEARVWLRPGAGAALQARRRQMVGPTGCGLCGVESLQQAVRTPPRVAGGAQVRVDDIYRALADLPAAQTLGAATRAVHAAALWTAEEGLIAVREDVGRHNALDKLAGALARSGRTAGDGVLLLTSRISVEMVQKAAVLGAQVVVAVSAPTTLAVATAEAAGVTLVGVARADGFEVFTRPDRILE